MPDNWITEEEMDYLNTFGGDDGSPDTPFGSHASTMQTMTLTPPPLKQSSAALEALGKQAPMPIAGKPKLWQRIAAGAIGGAAGLVNAGGRVRVDASPAIEGIYAGNTPYEQAKWGQERQRLTQAAQLEHQQNQQAVAGYRAQTEQQNAGSRALAAAALARRNDAAAQAALAPKWGATAGGIFQDRTGEFKRTAADPVLKVSPGQGVQGKDGTFTVPVPKVEKPIDPMDAKLKQARIDKLNRPDRGGGSKGKDPDVERQKNEDRIIARKSAGYTKLEERRKSDLAAISKEFDQQLKTAKGDAKAALSKAKSEKIAEVERSHVERKNAFETDIGKQRQSRGIGGKGGSYNSSGEWEDALEGPDSIETPANPYRKTANPYRK